MLSPHRPRATCGRWTRVSRSSLRCTGATPLQDATGTLGGRSLASIERALRLDRHEPRSALEHARILWFTGGSGASVDSAFAEAFSHYPAYPLARAEYALYLAQSGRADESLTNLEIARLASDSDQERLAAIAAAEKALAADSE